MKILIVTEFFPKSNKGEITGGVEARCFFVRKYLQKMGHRVEIVAEFTSGQRWSHLSFKTILNGPAFYIKMLSRVIKYFKEEVDLIEGTNYTTYPIAWFLGLVKQKPVVFYYPDVFIGEWVRNLGYVGVLGELAERIILFLPVDKYIITSLTTMDKLVNCGVRRSKIELIPCGFDPEEVAKLKTLKVKKYDISLVSRLVGYKKVDVAIRAVNLLKKKDPKISLAIVGQGPERESLQKLSSNLRLSPNIMFVGHLQSHIDVLRLIKSSRILVHPSEAEGFGIIVIESAALSVPSVVSDIPTLVEISENGKTGGLFKHGDPSSLAKEIDKLLSNGNLYRSKCLGAITLAKKYNWKDIATKTANLYENLCSN